MSHFYGTLQGSRGSASRCGTRNSGIKVVAASWQGAVETTLYEKDGRDHAMICFIPWHEQGTAFTLYNGPIAPTLEEIRDGLSVRLVSRLLQEGAEYSRHAVEA